MTQHKATVTIIVDDKDEAQFVGNVGETEAYAWQMCLGWPTTNEIKEHQRAGWYAAQATLTWELP